MLPAVKMRIMPAIPPGMTENPGFCELFSTTYRMSLMYKFLVEKKETITHARRVPCYGVSPT